MASAPKDGLGTEKLKRSSIELHPIPGDDYRGGSAAGAIRRSMEIQQGVRRSGSMEAPRRTSTEMKRDKMGLGKTDNQTVRKSIEVIVSVKESSARASMTLERKAAAEKAAAEKGAKLDTVPESKGKATGTEGKATGTEGKATGAEGEKEPEKVDMDEHKVPWEELCKRFSTDLTKGLTEAQAAINLEKYGKNALTPPKTTPEWVKYMLQMVTPFAVIMWIAAVLCFIGYGLDQSSIDSLVLALALIFVIFATGTFAWYQEKQSGKIMENFTKLLPTMARVIRDGTKRDIDAVELVPGDVVEIISGNKIPADIRIIEQAIFKVDNSSLTGESEPCSRSKDCTDDNPFETKNLAYFSTLAVDGTAKGMVIFTGDHTLIGRIANLASTTVKRKSPIAVEIHHFVLVIGGIGLSLGIIFFCVGFKVYGTSDIIKNIVLAIGIIVANVPEGLPATVTMCLTHAAHVMASKNVLVKSLEAVETLGSTSAICSDKTGTLTQNRMTLMQFFYNLDFYAAAHDGAPKSYNKEDPVFKWLHKVMTLGSKAQFAPGQEDIPVLQRQAFGDATETGMIKFCEPIESIEKMRLEYPKIMELAFNSKNKFALSIHEEPQAGYRFLCMKGAPERIIERCNRMLILEDGAAKEIPLDAALKDKLNESNEDLGSRGMRVLGVCMSILDTKVYNRDYVFDVEAENYPTNNLCFLGLAALIDPPKETVPMAVHKCQTAGITVIMVTGDHPITAKAIAKEVGIIHGETIEDVAKRMKCSPKEVAEKYPEEAKKVTAIVVAGVQIKDFVDADWDRVLAHPEVVFARTTPEQKLIIVEQNQCRNRIVAVTGDGVNDSPALKKADIGVAMGISGSDVSKEAAKMVLLDDNFASIVSGVEEGRLIFDNLKKSIAYTLEHLGPEVIPYLISFILETPIPLTTILILCIDLGTDIAPAISFAYEVPESDIMDRPPRNPKVDKLAGWRLFLFSYLMIGILETAATLFTYFIVFNTEGIPSSYLLGTAKDWEDPDYLRGCCTAKNADGTVNTNMSFESACCTTCQIPASYINLGYDQKCDASVMWLWDQATGLPFRDEIWRKVNTAVWFSIVVGQWGGIVVCKTRKLSVFQQGMWNWPMNYTLIFEVALSFFIIMTPGVQDVLGTTGIQPIYWFTAAPFAFGIVVFDEIRKWSIRRYPGGWVEFISYY